MTFFQDAERRAAGRSATGEVLTPCPAATITRPAPAAQRPPSDLPRQQRHPRPRRQPDGCRPRARSSSTTAEGIRLLGALSTPPGTARGPRRAAPRLGGQHRLDLRAAHRPGPLPARLRRLPPQLPRPRPQPPPEPGHLLRRQGRGGLRGRAAGRPPPPRGCRPTWSASRSAATSRCASRAAARPTPIPTLRHVVAVSPGARPGGLHRPRPTATPSSAPTSWSKWRRSHGRSSRPSTRTATISGPPCACRPFARPPRASWPSTATTPAWTTTSGTTR